MKLALTLLTKDRPELTKRSIEPLLQPDKFDLFIIDGSLESSLTFGTPYEVQYHGNVRGGPDAAIVYALTKMLAATEDNDRGKDRLKYTHLGIIEQDVLLHPDWFGPTLVLFERGNSDGLEVGAVSARSYDDRILCQRDGYALMHNLGAGMVIYTREAARLVLDNYRTGWSLDNRTTFSQLCGLDIARWWAFRGGEHSLTADWHFDTILARHGLASLALTPTLVAMLDQDIHEQGLQYAGTSNDLLRNDDAFKSFVEIAAEIRAGKLSIDPGPIEHSQGSYSYYPHQISGIGGAYTGAWRLRWSQGLGPFAWQAAQRDAALNLSLLGTADFLVSGGREGGQVVIEDFASGYTCQPHLLPEGQDRQVLRLSVPGGCTYRSLRLRCMDAGVTFYGIRTQHPQPWYTGYRFDHSKLPPVEG